MQFTPKTEAQIAEENLLPEGEYPFTVQVATEKVSKKGNPMIEVQLEVYDADGRGRKVTDYLMESMAFKLIHFAQTVGMHAEYESGSLAADVIQGRSGRVKIKIEPAGEYPAKNSVKDYVKPTAEAKVDKQPAASPVVDDPSLPPF